MQSDLRSIANDGVLRVAYNTGNRALVQENNGRFSGVSPALSQRLADQIGARLQPVVYAGAGKVFADADKNRWDVAFFAVDATRAENVAFTRPYVSTEATYAVRADSTLRELSDVDKPGVEILTARGSAYEIFLSSALANARLERLGTPVESFEAFNQGQSDAVAGVRASLMRYFGKNPTVRILPGVLTRVEQAMVLPDRYDHRIVALDDFVKRAISDGFVAEALAALVVD